MQYEIYHVGGESMTVPDSKYFEMLKETDWFKTPHEAKQMHLKIMAEKEQQSDQKKTKKKAKAEK